MNTRKVIVSLFLVYLSGVCFGVFVEGIFHYLKPIAIESVKSGRLPVDSVLYLEHVAEDGSFLSIYAREGYASERSHHKTNSDQTVSSTDLILEDGKSY
jgi:hypothetical protein